MLKRISVLVLVILSMATMLKASDDMLIRNETGGPLYATFVYKNALTGKLLPIGWDFSLDAEGIGKSIIKELPKMSLGETRQLLVSKVALQFSNDRKELINYRKAGDIAQSGGAALLVGVGRTSGFGKKKTAIVIRNGTGNQMYSQDIDYATWINAAN